MSKRDRRQKASDVFRGQDLVFGNKVTFNEAFPEIEDLRVEVEQLGNGVTELNRIQVYNKEYFPGEFIDCKNPLCYNGGFSIGYILRDMVRKGETEFETSIICQGYEGSPKGRRKYGECMNLFKIKVSIQYKETGN